MPYGDPIEGVRLLVSKFGATQLESIRPWDIASDRGVRCQVSPPVSEWDRIAEALLN